MSLTPVLIIEDDDGIAALLMAVLSDAGYAVVPGVPCHDAVPLLAARGPDAFSLILAAPATSPAAVPYAWLNHVRALTHAPVVICSRWPHKHYADYRAQGYAAVLAQPTPVENLVGLVASLLGGRGKSAGHDVAAIGS